MSVKYIFGGLALLVLTSCDETGDAVFIEYLCEDGKKLGVKWSGDIVDVKVDNDIFQLPQAVSASGARYTDDVQEIWEHQGEVRWSDGEKNITYCKAMDEEG